MLISSEEWVERQLRLKKNIYMGGELAGRDHPLIVPGRNVIVMTYDMALDPNTRISAQQLPIWMAVKSTAGAMCT